MAKLQGPTLPFEKIGALTRVQRILICIGTVVLLGGGFFWLFYMPKSAEIKQLGEKYDDLQAKVAKAKTAAQQFDRVQKEYKEAQGKFKLVLQLLPDKKEIPSLLESISSTGRQAGLEFLLFQPSKEVSKGFYAEIPVKIEVTGDYHNVTAFLDKVSRLPRIVNISEINIQQSKGGKGEAGTLKASCVATTYRFIETAKTEQGQKSDQKSQKQKDQQKKKGGE